MEKQHAMCGDEFKDSLWRCVDVFTVQLGEIYSPTLRAGDARVTGAGPTVNFVYFVNTLA